MRRTVGSRNTMVTRILTLLDTLAVNAAKGFANIDVRLERSDGPKRKHKPNR